MKLKKYCLLIGLLGHFVVAGSVYATDVVGDASVGSTGLGLHASIPFNKDINVRLGVNYMKLSTIMKDPDGDTDVNVTLNTFDGLLDWFPLESTFHVTGGLVYNGNKIDTVTKLNGVTFEGSTFAALPGQLGQVNGNFKVGNIISPYIGIGWGNVLKQKAGWGFTSDVGLLFHGKPQISLNNTGCTAGPVICAEVAKKVAEEEVKLNDEYARKIVYPVARVGVSYKF